MTAENSLSLDKSAYIIKENELNMNYKQAV